ncbi:fimbrial assembly protein [Rahnella variigena]|jgi:P pilus assembly chaperone PapD|uniref:fimbrial biogenesis chaperone n=2 Tax=Yersiniaceae TaxID=1903411 RepID=UPI000DE91E2A|nr:MULTISPECIES: molecular chaperone [Rahnella]RBQ32888.1 fimbrial assembly protein [Rahnella aquatilis]RYJ19161.1 fimbrial assembly protein [Rahnella variigena]TCQ88167.1 P pilus assembly chaperone PapD [Rahnella sp. JUb53]
MKKMILRCVAVLMLAGACYPAVAAVNLDRTRIIYNASDKSVSVMLENQSKELPYLAQVWLENAQGEKITSPLVALPPMQRIDAGQKSQIRILQLPETAGLPKDRESLFYFNVREVPPKSDMANVMQVAIQSRVKLFFRPAELRKLLKADWQEQLQVSRLSNGLKLTNPTPFYITVGYLGKDNKGNASGFDSVMLAPFATESLTGSQYVSDRYSLGYMDDYGGLQVNQYHCPSVQCQLISKDDKR